MARPKKRRSLIQPDEPLPDILWSAIARPEPGVDSEQLLRDIIDVWGGSRRLAVDLCKEFQFAQPGAMVRQRILEMIQRLIVQTTNQGMATAVNPSDLDDQDLEATVRSYFNRMISDDDSNGDSDGSDPRSEPPTAADVAAFAAAAGVDEFNEREAGEASEAGGGEAAGHS